MFAITAIQSSLAAASRCSATSTLQSACPHPATLQPLRLQHPYVRCGSPSSTLSSASELLLGAEGHGCSLHGHNFLGKAAASLSHSGLLLLLKIVKQDQTTSYINTSWQSRMIQMIRMARKYRLHCFLESSHDTNKCSWLTCSNTGLAGDMLFASMGLSSCWAEDSFNLCTVSTKLAAPSGRPSMVAAAAGLC